MRGLILLATVAGLAAMVAVVGSVGAAPVLEALRAVGWLGFTVVCLWSLGTLVVLGAAWRAVTPDSGATLVDFAWSRTVREAATDVLPFSQFGGLVVGARALASRGVPEPLIYASMVADLTTEMASQLVFTLAGVGLLILRLDGRFDDGNVLAVAIGGCALTAALVLALAFGQRGLIGIAGRLGARLLPRAATAMAGVQAALDRCYRDRAGVLMSFLLNLLAWVGSAAGAWIALRFMGSDLPLASLLAIEALVFAVRSIAFVVPGGLGVQEGAYLLLSPLFGLDPGTAVALSLLKRARDLAIGVPAIVAWQAMEGRRLLG